MQRRAKIDSEHASILTNIKSEPVTLISRGGECVGAGRGESAVQMIHFNQF